MEGEQKFTIPLDSPLDINSNDMLVPVKSPKFAFNRQRYLGSLLQNSVRYEDDGWFAGWWGHTFDFKSTGAITIEPEIKGVDPEQLYVFGKQDADGNPWYVVQQKSAGIKFNFIPESWTRWDWGDPVSGDGIGRPSDTTVQINGTIFDKGATTPATFHAEVNPYTGKLITYGDNVTGLPMEPFSELRGGLLHFKTQGIANPGGDYIIIRKNKPTELFGVNAAYTRDANVSHWGGVFDITDVGAVTAVNPEFKIDGFTRTDDRLETEYDTVKYTNETVIKTKDTVDTKLLWGRDTFTEVKFAKSRYLGAISDDATEASAVMHSRLNTQSAAMAMVKDPDDGVMRRVKSALPTHDNYMNFMHATPIWLRFSIAPKVKVLREVSWNGRVGFNPSGDPPYPSNDPPLLVDDQSVHVDTTTVRFDGSDPGLGVSFHTLINTPAEAGILYQYSFVSANGPRIDATVTSDTQIDTGGGTLWIWPKNIHPKAPIPLNADYLTAELKFELSTNTEMRPQIADAINALIQRTTEYKNAWFDLHASANGILAQQQVATQNTVATDILAQANGAIWTAAANVGSDVATQVGAAKELINAAETARGNAATRWQNAQNDLNWIIEHITRNNPYASKDTLQLCIQAMERYMAWAVAHQSGDGSDDKETLGYWGVWLCTQYTDAVADELWSHFNSFWNHLYAVGTDLRSEVRNLQSAMLYFQTAIDDIQPYINAQEQIRITQQGIIDTANGVIITLQNEQTTLTNEQSDINNNLRPAQVTIRDNAIARLGQIDTRLAAIPGLIAAQQAIIDDPASTDADKAAAQQEITNLTNEQTALNSERPGVLTTRDNAINQIAAYDTRLGQISTRLAAIPGLIAAQQTIIDTATPIRDAAIQERNRLQGIKDNAQANLTNTLTPWVTGLNTTVTNVENAISGWNNGASANLRQAITDNNGRIGVAKAALKTILDSAEYIKINETKVTFPDSTQPGYEYYEVLNTPNLDARKNWFDPTPKDENLLDQRTDGFALNIPICCRAYSWTRIRTVDIILSNHTGFTLETLTTDDTGINCFREDDDPTTPLSLKLCVPKLMRIQADPAGAMPDACSVPGLKCAYINYEAISPTFVYTLQQPPPNEDGKYDPPLGADWLKLYPAWILNMNDVAVNNGFKPVNADFENGSIGLRIDMFVIPYHYLKTTGSHAVSYDPSPYNARLLDGMVGSVVADAPKSGVFAQEVTIRPNKNFGDPTKEYTKASYRVDLPTHLVTGITHVGYVDWTNLTLVPKWNTDETLVIEGTWKLTKVFEADFYRTFILKQVGLTSTITIDSQDVGRNLKFNNGYGTLNLTTGKLTNSTQMLVLSFENKPDILRLDVVAAKIAEVWYLPKGIFARSIDDIEYVDSTWDDKYYSCTFLYKGDEYTIKIDKTAETSTLVYNVTDIRNGEVKEVYRRDVSDAIMFIKQFWSNDVKVENFWWIDPDHVLELSKYSMTLYKKLTKHVDDWMGDRWKVEQQVPRGKFVGSGDLYYTVSSSYGENGRPIFFKLRVQGEQILVMYISDILQLDFDEISAEPVNPAWSKIYYPVAKAPIPGTLKDTARILSYSELNVPAMITTGKISSTMIDGFLLIGLALDRGLKQWVMRINVAGQLGTVGCVGYGHVGVDGGLTGGQIPGIVCDKSGEYTGIKEDVHPLSILNDVLDSIPNKIVGNDTQIWFVYNQIQTIISHFTWFNGIWTAEELELNNNLAEDYQSESFLSSSVLDVMPQTMGVAQLLALDAGGGSNEAGEILAVFAEILLPQIFYLNPKYAQFAFINQSLGQYSYVWRNAQQELNKGTDLTDAKGNADPGAGADKKEFKLTDCDISFKLTTSEKEQRLVQPDFNAGNVFLGIILKGIEYADDVLIEHAANKEKAERDEDDEGGRKKHSFALENIMGTVGAALMSFGPNLTMSSTISFKYYLNMFYSITSKTQCFAGPGFVQHALQAQCMAQSVTDIQLDARKYNYWVTLKSLTMAAIKLRLVIMQFAYDAMNRAGDSVANLGVDVMVLGTGATAPIGLILSAVFQGVAAAMMALMAITEASVPLIEGLCDILGPEVGKTNDGGSLRKRSLQLEYPHAYGDRPMVFLWPVFGVNDPVSYTNEFVRTAYIERKQDVKFGKDSWFPAVGTIVNTKWSIDSNADISGKADPIDPYKGTLYSVFIACYGENEQVKATTDMAVIEGVTQLLPATPFKNEQIGEDPPAWPQPLLHDFSIYNGMDIELGMSCIGGEILCVTCDDTKLIDGPPSNVLIIPDKFYGIASSYIAMEIKPEFDIDYLRPVALTPQCIALNINRINVVQDAKAYHAFDGYSNRYLKWTGGTGLGRSTEYLHYSFQINNHFKRSNIHPPMHIAGIFNGPPNLALRTYDITANILQNNMLGMGMANDIPGEAKDLQRMSLPVHSDVLSTLPAMVRTLAPYKLHVVEGVTSLVTELRNTRTRYKAPSSVDFNIDGVPWRATEEFICSITTKLGLVAVQDVVASAGLTFIGATTKEAFFYSPATRMYYSFAGERNLTKRDIFNRFKDIQAGRWDFVNQEVMFKCLLGVGKDDKGKPINDVIICRLDKDVMGELYPPNPTIYNERSDFKLFSVSGGTVYQGPRRFIVSRFITLDSMFDDIRKNKRKWEKLSREEYPPERDYRWKYDWFENTDTPADAIAGWTHNPFRVATAMLGIDEETDCKFEWELTFAWTETLEELFELNEFVCVNLAAETVTPGGKLLSPVTHVFLFKECFMRSGNAGYYTFKFQSNNGIGNRERIYVWSDGILALEDLSLYCKNLTKHRTMPLHSQVDVQTLSEQ